VKGRKKQFLSSEESRTNHLPQCVVRGMLG